MKIDRLMNTPVWCRGEDNLNRAAQLMWEHAIGLLPVVDPGMRVVGVITDRDICMGAYTQGKPLADIPVDVAMAKTAVCCRAEDTVSDAEATMREGHVRRLPVLDVGGRLVGVVSLGDLACEAAAERTSGLPAVRFEEVGATLAGICQPAVAIAVA